jgi:tRNA dimethylallyltransferase
MPRDPQRSLPPAILLMGPTASGKTAVVQALARRLPVEVVSVDSAQLYRDMDIGTAKPTPAELAECPHHLIDLISPEESYSAARFRADAIRLIADIAARGRVPLLAGGTLLYFKALREGLSSLPAADPRLRREIEARAAALGWPALHAELAARDPQAAARLERNDAQRIQRALEIVLLTGAPLAQSYARREQAPLPFRPLAIALLPSVRAELHERIARRFDDMLARGFVEEVQDLRRRYSLHPALPSMRCVGYRQVWDYLEGTCDRQALRDKGIFATRQLAKRQLTWLRSFRDVAQFDCLDRRVVERIREYLQRALEE